ncbi:MAG: prepilin-type N-terminal cleavage/methylation domain-containing protein, partial [Candidatus Rokubacteria bacterium]|nr:prepilin-type N-terminal cleavage/methylation domain-containing protein [Candidatus Rokubacteria bacterium]
MNIRRHGRTDQRGFTLAELLVVIAVIGVIMIGILTLLMTGNQSYL